jgi:hypothetical protein
MNTQKKRAIHVEDAQAPVVSFTQMIAVAPSSASFGGWGPHVLSRSNLIRWN